MVRDSIWCRIVLLQHSDQERKDARRSYTRDVFLHHQVLRRCFRRSLPINVANLLAGVEANNIRVDIPQKPKPLQPIGASTGRLDPDESPSERCHFSAGCCAGILSRQIYQWKLD